MAKTGKLTALEVRNAGVGKHGDGGGLWLRVRPNGSRAWLFRYTWAGREREMGLGPTDRVSLAEAREAARDARKLVARGVDPISHRRATRRAVPTFKACAEAYIEAHAPGWRHGKTRRQ
ncbi:MAG: DUF4102 domain-containing protein, partial [Acidobacteria bacterium]|nr:DUF4102 domain-containing protein [Acidobacteriota bacterium]